MATEHNFVSVPLDGRDVTDLEARLREHAGPGAVAMCGAVSSGVGSVTVRVPTDPDRRAEVLRIVRLWREAAIR